jgi:Domain of unknown function (DUF4160)
MVTIIRKGGLRIVIYKDDHPPPHVHLIADGRAKIMLVGPDGAPELVRAYGLSAGDVRKAMKIVQDQQFLLMRKWKEIHGGTD